jgi:hypothetical protein
MRTIFTTGIAPQRSPWIGSAAEGLPQMSSLDRDALVNRLKRDLAVAHEIQRLVDWSHDNDPYLRKFFGDDQGAFWLMWGELSQYQPVVEGVYKRLSHDDPEFWSEPSNSEQDALDAWLPGIESVGSIYSEHLYSLAPGKRPGVAPSPAPVPAPAPALPEPGPTTTEFIVAGVLVAAIGAAVYTLL